MSLSATAAFNAQASLNAWLVARIGAFTLPAWLPTVSVVFNWADITASLPCFSVAHIEIETGASGFKGRAADGRAGAVSTAILEVSAWVQRDANANHTAQLNYMADMVTQAVIGSGAGVQIYDYGTPNTPTPTSAVITLDNVQPVSVEMDTNPGIERKRLLVPYRWIYRVS